MRLYALGLSILLLAGLSISALSSDFDFGSTARSISLGGAGLALGDEFHSTAVNNPAAPAVYGKKLQFIFPGLDFKKSGASVSDIVDNIGKLDSGNESDALSLANDFSSQNTSLSFSSVAGFSGTTGILVNAEVIGRIIPSQDVMNWSKAQLRFDNGISFDPMDYVTQLNNANLTSAVNNWTAYSSSGLASDKTAAETAFNQYLVDLSTNTISAAFVWGPTVQLSGKMPSTSGDLWLGTNISILTSESRQWTIQAKNPGFTYSGNDISVSSLDFEAVEVPTKRKTSLKVDVGMLYRPNDSIWQYGVVVNNFIKPNLRGVTNSQEDPMISFGVAAKPINGFLFVADLVNLTGANGESVKLRSGAEYHIGNFLALRAGYSGDRVTYGFNAFGIDLAFSEDSPNILSKAFKF